MGQAAAATLSPAENALLAAVNRARAKHGLRPLTLDRHLERAAMRHSRWMLRTGAFSHSDFSYRIVRAHAAGPTFGENLAWGSGSKGSPDAIVQAWLDSPAHRANLLRPGFRRIGLGELVGAFAGTPSAVVVTADFAGR